MTAVRRLVVLGVLAVATAACSDSGGGEAASTTTEAPESTGSTTTTTTSTTTTEPVPFDVEVKRAAIELLEIRNDVFQHPDVARVSEYISDTCVCLERERGFIERFVNEGLRWTAPIVQVRGINLTVAESAQPALTVVATEPTADLVRADGGVTQHVEQFDEATYSITLLRGADGEWRLNGFEGIALNPETIASVLAEGVP